MSAQVTLQAGAIPAPAIRQGPPCVMVVFGASGDLTKRKLVPALYNLAFGRSLSANFAAVGFARRDWSADAFREAMRAGVNEFSRRKPVDPAVWEEFAPRLDFVQGEFHDPAAYLRLAQRLQAIDQALGTEGNRLYYLATPPTDFPTILHRLQAAGLIARPNEGAWTRVILEKPFGRDEESAHALNLLVGRVLDESQTFRIDHYLGKETVQNILAFRFSNGMFEPLWSKQHVDHIQFTVGETVGVESRGRYYDTAGVLRDMVQNHMFQMLAYLCMEPPSSVRADAVRNEKAKLLDSVRIMRPEDVLRDTVRGQ
ncbi:MAG TPA: glucose-6-phosphate dehydrogenase, partial [Candidatus Sulfotelmatobacter sp.]|nr:glucose-6-phosphate dehydrogenase [Candidatus Sulfotelmatobacter sp.]